MSDAATRKQQFKRHWAEPGSRHDALVRGIKFGLPIAIIGFILILAIAPFRNFFELLVLPLNIYAIIAVGVITWMFTLRFVWRKHLFDRFLNIDLSSV